MLLRNAVLAAAAACLIPALAACGQSGAQLQAGDVVPARHASQFVKAQESSIATPIGTLEVHAGKPLTSLPASATRELTAKTAPSGTTFLPITWEFDPSPIKAYSDFMDTSTLPVVDLKSGDASYRLPTPSPGQAPSSFYLLIAPSQSDPTLSVDFEGVVQTADLTTGQRQAGRAKALYHLPRHPAAPKKCDVTALDWSEPARVLQSCKISKPVLLPYAGGKWAPAGSSWLVMGVATTLTSYLQAGTVPGSAGTYAVLGVGSSFKLGGKAPVKTIQAGNSTDLCPFRTSGTCNAHAYLVFRAKGAKGPLVVTQKYEMALYRGYNGFHGKQHQKVKETATIAVSLPH